MEQDRAPAQQSCETHPEAPSIGRCIDCGCYVCNACHVREEENHIYCLPCSERRAAGLDQNTVLLFWIFAGAFGAHRFYSGRILSGMLQLFSLGGLGLWSLFDLYLIMTYQFTDGEGRPLIDRS